MDRYDYIKLMQIKKVPRTSGRSNIFEGHITGKSKIVKIHWKYVCFFDMIHEIFTNIKNGHFQRLAWYLSILERFAIFVVCNVTRTQ